MVYDIVGTETRFVRGLGYQCLQERDSSNTVTVSYVWDPVAPGGIGGLLEMDDGTDNYSYLYDAKGNVAALIDGSDNIVAAYAYDVFGNTVSESGTLDQPYRFSTKRYYDGFGISYYGFRFYQPAIGRWLTRDPIGIKGGLNLYGFVGNSAISLVDPWGLADFNYKGHHYVFELGDHHGTLPPGEPHIDRYGKNGKQKVGLESGNIYDKNGRTLVGKLSKKELKVVQDSLKFRGVDLDDLIKKAKIAGKRGNALLGIAISGCELYDATQTPDPEEAFEDLLDKISTWPKDEQEEFIQFIMDNNPDMFKDYGPADTCVECHDN